ncbi:MAG: DUF1345 domain-containing protein [Chitinophagaceae bacterium]|nr:DUF1345 domain-containing protein [Oligoflexus sp.]
MIRIKGVAHHVMKHSIVRLMLSVLVGIAVTIIADKFYGWAVSIVAGFDAGALLLLLVSWTIILRSTAAETKARAASEDPGRNLVFLLVSLASAVSLFASAYVLRQAKSIAPNETFLLAAVCLAAVTLCWFLTHTAFTFRYARMYYDDRDEGSGLIFPGSDAPADFDFAYFSFTLGMAFQTSDVCVSSRDIRQTVLFHSLLSFAYNTTLVALTLNIFFGILG